MFHGPKPLAGDVLTYRGADSGIEERNGETMASPDLAAERTSGAVVTRARADFATPGAAGKDPGMSDRTLAPRRKWLG